MKKFDFPIVQYLRPDGTKRTIYAEFSEKYYNMAKEKDVIISAELLIGNNVCVYIRKSSQDEEDEIIEIFPNDENLTKNTEKMIERV